MRPCLTCNQLTRFLDLIDVSYCSLVCKSLKRGGAQVLWGTYWSWPASQNPRNKEYTRSNSGLNSILEGSFVEKVPQDNQLVRTSKTTQEPWWQIEAEVVKRGHEFFK